MTGPKPVQTPRTGIVSDQKAQNPRHQGDETETEVMPSDDNALRRSDGDVPVVHGDETGTELTEPKPTKLRARRKRRNRLRERQLREVESPTTVVSLQGLTTPEVPKARPRRRHYLMIFSFFLMVVVPAVVAVAYLYTRAEDSYASTAAFSIHMEENQGAAGMLSGLPAMGLTTQSSDADIIHQYIQSQALVEKVDQKFDLRALYGSDYEKDPVFALDPNTSVEGLVDYWQRIVTVLLEPDSGLVTVEVRAFEPVAAQSILQEILDASAALIDQLSKIARDDTIRLAQEELDESAEHLKETRLQVAQFRDVEQIVDPTADLASQMGVISALQQSLADAMIRRDMLIGTTTNDDDPRLQQADRAIEAIQARIADERENIGARQQEGADDPLSRIVGEYEGLLVDREFAEQSYLAALTAYDQALAEARRKSRYLAVHIPPTRAETAIYPRREVLAALSVSILLVVWALFILIAYSVRDRR
ncbi:MAG: hypothetical protein AAGH83_08265 [Pseudomonadota bacterium]